MLNGSVSVDDSWGLSLPVNGYVPFSPLMVEIRTNGSEDLSLSANFHPNSVGGFKIQTTKKKSRNKAK